MRENKTLAYYVVYIHHYKKPKPKEVPKVFYLTGYIIVITDLHRNTNIHLTHLTPYPHPHPHVPRLPGLLPQRFH